jgi:hypothetical protein
MRASSWLSFSRLAARSKEPPQLVEPFAIGGEVGANLFDHLGLLCEHVEGPSPEDGPSSW